MFDPTADPFSIFGLEPRHDIDRDALEQRYLELSRAVHPDRFAGASSSEQRQAMERSSALNVAYRTVRDPVRRAEHLVKLGGIDLDSTDPKTGAPHPGQGFLVEMIELREELDGADGATVEGVRERVEERAEEVFDRGLDAIAGGDTAAAAQHLVIHRYLLRFLEEVDGDH